MEEEEGRRRKGVREGMVMIGKKEKKKRKKPMKVSSGKRLRGGGWHAMVVLKTGVPREGRSSFSESGPVPGVIYFLFFIFSTNNFFM